MKTKTKTHRVAQGRLFHLIVIATFAVVGASLYAFSSAATNDNPVGFADFCRLENNKTVIYGWAHDNPSQANQYPSVKVVVGSQAVTTYTDIDGYRDSAINSYLSSNGYTPTSRYGYKATFSGIYKGSAPSISGTVYNTGSGMNQSLLIYSGSQNISAANNGAAYFVNGKVPDACLPSQPVVPGPDPVPNPNPNPTPFPNPTPTPTPTPNPTPTGGGGSGTTTKQTPKSGTNGSTPSSGTNTQSPSATPTNTSSFTLKVTLLNKGEPLKDLSVKLTENSTETTTDSNGVATFIALTEPNYTIHFDFENNTYESVLGISTEEMSKQIVEQTVEVSELTPLTQDSQQSEEATAPKKSGKGWLVICILLLIAAAAGIFVFIKRRRNSAYTEDYSYPLTTGDTPPQGQVNDAGISLKDLVVDSMRKEAARHHKDDQS